MKQARTLRIFQILAIIYDLIVFRFLRKLPATSSVSAITLFKLLIVFLALYSAVAGFTFQKRFLRPPKNLKVAVKSTPIKRWMIGNVIRLAFAFAVSLYGFVLHFAGGPEWLATSLVALGLVLLLIWRPGAAPVEQNQQADQ
jgi:hypothetical protein